MDRLWSAGRGSQCPALRSVKYLALLVVLFASLSACGGGGSESGSGKSGLLYSDGGAVLNPATNTVVGQYTFPQGVPFAALTIDPVNNRVFAAYTASTGVAALGTIQSFNLAQFSPIWIARLPIGTQPLRWGSNGLAWIGPSPTVIGARAVYLINGTFVAP